MNGVGRSPSLRNGAGLSRPSRPGSQTRSPQTSYLNNSTYISDETDQDDARAEHVALLEELRGRVQKAETASEEYQRQLNLLQARLDESQHEQGQLEDRLHQSNAKVEGLENDQVAARRQWKDTEQLFDTERDSLLHDKAEQQAKIEELQVANQRMKENLAHREKRGSVSIDGSRFPSRTNSGNELGQFAPSLVNQIPDGNESSRIVSQKDRVIKSLRLELAEAQIKIMEIDSKGGGQAHELEKKLMEVKVANARLVEDNESFQLLLSEKTLNGDFSKTEAMQQSSGLGSLAEELGSEEQEPTEETNDISRQLETEVKSLKDQNKALALYIERIIGRLMQHKELENILDKNPDLMSGAPRPQAANVEKDLPPPPPPKDEEQPTGFLQRARSVVSKRPRPLSQMVTSTPPPTLSPSLPSEEHPILPSMPMGRSESARGSAHKRTQSDMPNPAPGVSQMYLGPPSTGSGAPLVSPGISPGVPTATRTSFFSNNTATTATGSSATNATSRAPSSSRLSQDGNLKSSSNSTFSDDHSGGMDSPPRSNGGNTNYTGAVMTQNRLRPLRLVQENPAKEEDAAAVAARKKANRGSWIPAWMGQRVPSSENM